MSFRCISFILTFLLFACSNNIILAKEQEKGIKYIGEMNVQRALHNSKKLNDGTVLIFGGYNKMTEYSDGRKPPSYHQEYSKEETYEIYNPIDNTFKITDLKTDLPKKKVYFQILSEQEKNRTEEFFKDKNISFDCIGYQEINEEKILCIPFNRINLTVYGIGPFAKYFTVYDLKTKKN